MLKLFLSLNSAKVSWVKMSWTGFLNSMKSGGNWNFSKSRGEKKRGERGVFEIFIGGEIAGDETSNRKQNFRIT